MSDRQRIEEDAARWVIRRGEAGWDQATQAELDAWLDASMAHRAAFWRLGHGWREADRVAALVPTAPPRRPPSVRDMMARTRGASSRAFPITLAGALAAGLAAILVLPTWLAMPGGGAEHSYRTVIGQARTIETEDGSRIELNTATAVRTRVLADSRDAWLDRGEAFFDIRHEEGRPFRVHAGRKTITVLGTRFSVRRDGDKVTVAVVSGRVRIDDDAPRVAVPRSATVAAGDVAIAAGSSTLIAADAQPRLAALTAWRDGVVIFDQTPLGDAVAELNRYTDTPIVVDDPAVAGFRIGGSFRLDNSEGFLRLLRSAYGLNVTRREKAVHLSRP